MLKENAKRVASEKKLREEKEKLSQLHLITSSDELKEELLAIDKETISTTKKKKIKIELLKAQIRIRKFYAKLYLLYSLLIASSDLSRTL